ncbi:cytochrome c-type biogenesis protein CcmE [Azonexus fungiphilus]|jgi:cytochrome c-type biogenesis protein CcmE|uniref:Cytochrome c-type biogenesis protein CcmE n=1 Tax=Azonexus fungiphilus TaxID=146940 RepID=A0A495VPX1_9RHOO|nr:cytochrome c maturation protein CcmE [Azonexus fungiphilus]NHC07936.1 cytochrome c maturation protein CcmE [Azonexus fungiphilus]RKT51312.1 cytochrome c-type biogenesis protein CcmE [Azonexus fungiphilus]
MKSRHKKLALIGGAVALVGIIAALVLNALNSNIALYISPTDVAQGKAPQDKLFRIGGLVKEGSIQRQADGVTIRFIVTDSESDIVVDYVGILPDLFMEGKGAVAQGRLLPDGSFKAQEVLAKHDENYMPPEAAKALNDAHVRGVQKQAEQEAAKAAQPKASY